MLISHSVAAAASPPLSGVLCSCGNVYFSFDNPQGSRPEVGQNRTSYSGVHPMFVLGCDSYSSCDVENGVFSCESWRSLTSWLESLQSERHVSRFLKSDSAPMFEIPLGLPPRVTGRPNPCLDVLPRPPSLVCHNVSRRVLSVFSQSSDRACLLVIRLISDRVCCC